MISGKRKITVRMVAEAAGVSRTAVYAVLNRDAKNNIGLRPDTRRKIEKTIEELGYIPNNSARTLVSGRSNNIGILLNTSNVSSQIFADIQSSCLLDQTAGSSGCVESVLGEHSAVGDTQVLKQRFFCVMRDQSDVH